MKTHPDDIDDEDPTIEIVSVWGGAVKHEMLDKVGVRTGWTRGEVLETCKDRKVEYKDVNPDIENEDGTVTVNILCSVETDYLNWYGDSGAPVFKYISSTGRAQLRGIYYGIQRQPLRGYMSPFGQLDKDLGDRGMGDDWDDMWFYDPGLPRSTRISGPEKVHPDAKPCTWRADAHGGMTPFNYTWSGLFWGRSRTITGKVEESGYLAVTFKDAIGREVVDSLEILIDSSGTGNRCGGRPPIIIGPGGDTLDTPQ